VSRFASRRRLPPTSSSSLSLKGDRLLLEAWSKLRVGISVTKSLLDRVTYKTTNTAETPSSLQQWRSALPLRARVVDRLADILLAFNDILDMVEQDRELSTQVEPAVEKIWQKINEFSMEVERDLVRDFVN
jgi:hypothetical protein